MPIEMEIVEEIIERFGEEESAQGAINQFGFVSDDGENIIVSREQGQNTLISRNEILSAVQAVRGNHELYNGTVTEFRNVLVEKYDINRRIYQSLYALIRILPLNEITRE